MKWLDKFKFSLPPLPRPPPVHAPDRSTLLQLSLVVLIAVVAHFSIGSPIVAAYAFIIWAFKSSTIYRTAKHPPKLLVFLLTALSFVIVLVLYGGWNGQRAGISFLVLLASLKFLESSVLRDYYIVCLILLFLASCSFLFNSSLPNILMVVGYSIIITSILIKISSPTSATLRRTIGIAGAMMLKALPLALILFFFFPRIQGDFGLIPSQDELNSEKQLNNTLVAGEMASRAFDNALAFRVEFDDAVPGYSARYWRVKVMLQENNFQWSVITPTTEQLKRAAERPELKVTSDSEKPETYHYQVIHEISRDAYLPFLDYALKQSIGTQLDDHSVYRSANSDGVFAYQAISSASPTIIAPTGINRAQLLQTRSVPTARMQALLSQWRRETANEEQLVQRVFHYFSQNEFRYSLLPPLLGDNPIDEFLFDSRVGYCEHYASAFTTLMRWLGIPARVVAGYQGGAQNQVGGYFEIRYSDAHAWSEVWVNQQWQRVDPTAAISPERIEFGMDALLALWDGQTMSANPSGRALADFLNPSGFNQAYRRIRDSWNNIGYQWNKWVVNYDFDTQRQLLASLGFEHRSSLYVLIGLVFLGTLALMLFYFWQLLPRAIKIGEAQQIYLRFLDQFKRQKLFKERSETPNAFAQKAIQRFPQHTEELQAITDAYVTLRFGREPGSIELFKQQVNRFKLKPVKKTRQKTQTHASLDNSSKHDNHTDNQKRS